jgi:hypoxanthine phosphoribosyltransferase
MADYRNDEILVAEYQIDRGIDRVARQIASSRKNIVTDTPVILGVLNGSFMFTSELVRKLHIECYVDFCRVSSYPAGPDLKKEPQITCPPKIDVTGRDVYIVEDIVDTGETVEHLKEYLAEKGAARIYVVSLIKRESDTRSLIDYFGVEIDDSWVYGFGLDDNELRRNYRNIYAMKQTDAE